MKQYQSRRSFKRTTTAAIF